MEHQETKDSDQAAQDIEQNLESSFELEGVIPSIYRKNKKGSSDSSEDESEDNFKQNPYLPWSVQKKMEDIFGHDFSNVDIYKNSQKANKNGAQAFAYGNSLHFSSGQFNPYSKNGQALLKHELAHVVQQREGRTDKESTEKLELEAENAEISVAKLAVDKSTQKEVKNPKIQFKYRKITAEQITEIRGLLQSNDPKPYLAYQKLTQILGKSGALQKFLMDYPDIGTGFLHLLNQHNPKEKDAYIVIKNNFIPPVSGINVSTKNALPSFKTKHHLDNLATLAKQYNYTLEEILGLAKINSINELKSASDLILNLEKEASDLIQADPNLADFVHQLALYNMIESIEKQGGIKNQEEREAVTKSYFDEGFFDFSYGFLKGYAYARKKRQKNKRKALKEAETIEEKREIRQDFKTNKRLPPQLFLILSALSRKSTLKLTGVKLSDLEEFVHGINLGGISFDKDAIIDTLIIDNQKNSMTIEAKKLPINYLNSSDQNSGFRADQINLTNVKITLDIKEIVKDDDKIKLDETSKAYLTLKSSIDIHNLRIQDKETTIGLGRLRVDEFKMDFSQKISRRKTFNAAKIKNPTAFVGLVFKEMIMKGSLLVTPFIYGVMNVFTVSEIKSTKLGDIIDPKEIIKIGKNKDLSNGVKEMLSENLNFEMSFKKLTLDHLFLGNMNMTQQQENEGKIPYIEKLVLEQEEDKQNVLAKIEAISLTNELREIALRDENVKLLPENVKNKVLQITSLEKYQELVEEYHQSRSRYSESDNVIIAAAQHFEQFKKFKFSSNIQKGELQGAALIKDMGMTYLTSFLKDSGAQIEGLSGIENIKFTNLKINSTQSAQGIHVDKDNPVFQGISVDLEVPVLSADILNYITDDIYFDAQETVFKGVTISLGIEFLEPENWEEKYRFFFGEIKIKEAEINENTFNYNNGFLAFKSNKTKASDLNLKMTPNGTQYDLLLGFKNVAIFDAEVNFGGRKIKSKDGKPIILTGCKFGMDDNGMNFELKNLEIDGIYEDADGNEVEFKQSKNRTNNALFDYSQNTDGSHKKFKLNLDSTFQLPKLLIKLGEKDYFQMNNARITDLFADLELKNDDLIINTLSINEVKTSYYNLLLNGNEVKSNNQEALLLENLKLQNLLIKSVVDNSINENSNWKSGFNTSPIELPENYLTTQVLESKHELKNATDLSQQPKDQKLEKKQTVFSRSSEEEASFSFDKFAFENLIYNDDKNINILVNLFSLGGFSMSSINGNAYGIDELHKLFAHKKIDSFESKGEVKQGKGKREELVANWNIKTEEGKAIASNYDEKSNTSTFENLPLINLSLDKINLKVGDFSIKSKGKNTKNLAKVSDIRLGKITLNHTNNDLYFDKIDLTRITANGIELNSSNLSLSLPENTRASVNGIELIGWKTNVKNISQFKASGKKANINIANVVVPKITALLNDKTKGNGETTIGIGKIKFTQYATGATSLGVNDIAITKSIFKWKDESSYIENLLSSLTAKSITVEIDQNNRKTIYAKNPIFEGYEFEMKGLQLKADLHCKGELKIFEGNYEAFVNQMHRSLKSFSNENEIDNEIDTGYVDAWIIDGSSCKVQLKNIEYVSNELIDERTSSQKVLDKITFDKKSKKSGGPEIAWSPNSSNAFGLLGLIKDGLKASGRNKVKSQEEYLYNNRRTFQFTQVLNEVDGTIMAKLGENAMFLDIKDGKLDLKEIKSKLVALSDVTLRDINPTNLPQNKELRDIAQKILVYLESGLSHDAVLAFSLLGTLLGMIFGGVASIFGPFAFTLGTLLGALVGIILGSAFDLAINHLFKDIIGIIKDLCSSIIKLSDYRTPLQKLIEWFVLHLTLAKKDKAYYLVFRLTDQLKANEGTTYKDFPILKVGDFYDSHIDIKNQTVNLAGMIRFLIEHPDRADRTEFDLLTRIQKMEEANIPSHKIISDLYEPLKSNDEFEIGGVTGYLTRETFFDGVDRVVETLDDMMRDELLSNLKLYLILNNVDLDKISDVMNFDSNQELTWLNPDKTKLYTHVTFNEEGNLANGEIHSKLALGPMSGFILEEKNRAFGVGDFNIPQVIYNQKLTSGNDDMLRTTIKSEKDLSLNGIFFTKRKEDLNEQKVEIFRPNSVKNPLIQPVYKLMDARRYGNAIWEFTQLTGENLTHIALVDGDFKRYGDKWLFDLVYNEKISGESKIGFVRECKEKNNRIEYYIGTLKIDGFGSNRQYYDFTGKEEPNFGQQENVYRSYIPLKPKVKRKSSSTSKKRQQ